MASHSPLFLYFVCVCVCVQVKRRIALVIKDAGVQLDPVLNFVRTAFFVSQF